MGHRIHHWIIRQRRQLRREARQRRAKYVTQTGRLQWYLFKVATASSLSCQCAVVVVVGVVVVVVVKCGGDTCWWHVVGV